MHYGMFETDRYESWLDWLKSSQHHILHNAIEILEVCLIQKKLITGNEKWFYYKNLKLNLQQYSTFHAKQNLLMKKVVPWYDLKGIL